MRYEITGTPLPVAILRLNRGETIHSENGAMSWMSDGLSMKTNAGGSIGKAFSRAFSGESIFQNTYTAQVDDAFIAFASSFPGQILPIDVGVQPIVAQKSAFLARESTVDMAIHFQRKLGSGFFGGEGFIMQRFSGSGIVFLEIDGALKEYDLAPGETMILDTGYLAAMTASVKMDVTTVKGVGNVLFGGEGLFHTCVTGPGHIWVQTMPKFKMASFFATKS